MAMFLVGSAFLVDALQAFFDLVSIGAAAIPGVDLVATPALAVGSAFLGLAADICFFIWFALLGVSYTKENPLLKILTMVGMVGITVIPELDILPETTLGVLTLVVLTRLEDSMKDPKFLKKVGTAAKIVGTIQPELKVGTQVVELEAKRRSRNAEEERKRQQAVADGQKGNDELAEAA